MKKIFCHRHLKIFQIKNIYTICCGVLVALVALSSGHCSRPQFLEKILVAPKAVPSSSLHVRRVGSFSSACAQHRLSAYPSGCQREHMTADIAGSHPPGYFH